MNVQILINMITKLGLKVERAVDIYKGKKVFCLKINDGKSLILEIFESNNGYEFCLHEFFAYQRQDVINSLIKILYELVIKENEE